jgi:hypothetical protein
MSCIIKGTRDSTAPVPRAWRQREAKCDGRLLLVAAHGSIRKDRADRKSITGRLPIASAIGMEIKLEIPINKLGSEPSMLIDCADGAPGKGGNPLLMSALR